MHRILIVDDEKEITLLMKKSFVSLKKKEAN